MLTVVIPSYNHEQYILDCLKKAIEIEVGGKRIIVIDDGSSDSTVKIIKEYIDDNAICGIEVVEKKNSGLISSLNIGLSMARSEYFYLVASDDIPNPRGIVECIDLLKSDHALQFCIGGGVNFSESNPNETPIYGVRHLEFLKMAARERMAEMFLNYPSPLLLQSTVFRASALRAIGGWDPEIVLDDYPVFVKLLSKFSEEGRDFVFRPEISTVKYRHHDSNTYKNIRKQMAMVNQAMVKLAPDALKSKAIGKALAYYILAGLRRADFAAVGDIIKNATWAERGYAIPSVFDVMMKKFGKTR